MSQKLYFVITGVIFAIMALLHLFRSLNGWTFQVGALVLPQWISYLGLVVAGALSLWALQLARK